MARRIPFATRKPTKPSREALLAALAERDRELAEARQQQTATADVLEVISRSAFDLNAVFETVAESSVRLCGADRASIFRFDGEMLRMAVSFNASAEVIEFLRQNPIGRVGTAARRGPHSNDGRFRLPMFAPIPDTRTARGTPKRSVLSLACRSSTVTTF